MTSDELQVALQYLQKTMIEVATGGPRIREVNEEFQQVFTQVAKELEARRIQNPLPYANLWDWYGRWSSGDLPTYQSRRTFVTQTFAPLLELLRSGNHQPLTASTGWPRVDRCVTNARQTLATAASTEQFQVVGLLCREIPISLSQAAHDHDRHPSIDGVTPSETDVKRKLEAFIAVELAGGHTKEARANARSSLNLALALQHDRTATFRDAALCLESTTNVVNIIAIVSGLRDPD